MKTNHQRNYVDPGSYRHPRSNTEDWRGVVVGHGQEEIVKSKPIPWEFANGHHGAARTKHGAKSYVRSQIRKEGKRIVKRELGEKDDE